MSAVERAVECTHQGSASIVVWPSQGGLQLKSSAAPARPRMRVLALMVLSALAAVPLVNAPAQAQTAPEGVWERTGPLSVPRYDHSLTLLPNGRVLAAGGRTQGTNSRRVCSPSSSAGR